jgi:hypothetical protein
MVHDADPDGEVAGMIHIGPTLLQRQVWSSDPLNKQLHQLLEAVAGM